jgi:hypothetical protein
MDQATVKARLDRGEKTAIIQEFQQLNYYVTFNAIAQALQNSSLTSRNLFEIFTEVANFTRSPNQEVTPESVQKLKDGLKPLLPDDVVDQSNSFIEAIPAYLDSANVEVDVLFRQTWRALQEVGRDEETIGIGWAAFLYLTN